MRKAVYILMSAILVIAVAIGVVTRFSYTDIFSSKENLENAEISITAPYDPYYDESTKARLDSELASADICVKVLATDDRIIEDRAIKQRLKITEVYRGDVSVGDAIDYYEVNCFEEKTDLTLSSFQNRLKKKEIVFRNNSVTTLMKPNEEYVLFANKRDVSKYYVEKNGCDEYIAASWELSYFALNDFKSSITPVAAGEKLLYSQIENQEFMFFCEQDEKSITKYKEMVFEQLGIMKS